MGGGYNNINSKVSKNVNDKYTGGTGMGQGGLNNPNKKYNIGNSNVSSISMGGGNMY